MIDMSYIMGFIGVAVGLIIGILIYSELRRRPLLSEYKLRLPLIVLTQPQIQMAKKLVVEQSRSHGR